MNRTSHDQREPPLTLALFAGVLAAIMVFAAGLRLYDLGGKDYWLDELHSLMNSGGRFAASQAPPHGTIITDFEPMTSLPAASTLADVWRTSKRDAHPPLYFMLLHGWRRVSSDTETATRSLSVLFSVLSLAPLALMLRAMGRPRAGLLAASVMAVAFSAIFMSQQARPYGLGMFLVCTSYWLLVELTERRARARSIRTPLVAAYAVCLLLCMLTHYLTALALAPQVIHVFRKETRHVRWHLAAAMTGAALVWLLIWGGAFIGQLPFIRNQPWLVEDAVDHGLWTVIRVADAPMRLLLHHDLYEISTVRGVAGLLFALFVTVRVYPLRGCGARLFLMWCIVTVAFLLAVDVAAAKQTLAYIRYVSVATPALAGMTALAVFSLPGRVRWIVMAAILLTVVATLRLPTPISPDGRSAAAYVQRFGGPDTLVVYDRADYQVHYPARQLGIASHYLDGLHPPFVLLIEQPSEELTETIRRYRRLVLVMPPGRKVGLLSTQGYSEVFHSGYVEGIGTVGLYTVP